MGLNGAGLTASAAGSGGGGGSGTVTSVSVVSANGLAGTVANSTTTPAITISTTITGLLKGNGTAISAATAGTDYLAPTGSGSGLTGIVTSIVAGTNVTISSTGAGGTGAVTINSTGGGAGVSSFNTRTGAVVLSAADVESTFTAKGQLFAGTGSGTGDLVTTGTAGQVLTVGGADASGLEWTTPAGGSVVPSQYTQTTITSDPAPAVIGTIYRTNYSGPFTLPSSGLVSGDWVRTKQIGATQTVTVVGTVDGNSAFFIANQYDSDEFIWNGTNWDHH
jgi:hypothetical protein